MDRENLTVTNDLLRFISRSPTAYQTVDSVISMLEDAGFSGIDEHAPTPLRLGASYYITRNASSLIAFKLPSVMPSGFLMTASHSDSPTFKLKLNSELETAEMLKLDTERYGGSILSSWLDRPLSIAGRAVFRTSNGIISRNVNLCRDIAVIPNTAIHLNRTINDGYRYDLAREFFPLIGNASDKGKLNDLIAEVAGYKKDALISADLYLYNRTAGSIFGIENEFFSAPRIDDLQCAYATLKGFLASSSDSHAIVYCLFDNEEVGSTTRQGAASTMLRDLLTMISESLSLTRTDMIRLLASSMMLSTDNGHALHPNRPELSDPINAPRMNGGVVVKFNAAQKYTTDAISASIFTEICRNAGVPVQSYANRSDLPGGSTLGNISTTQVPLITVDIGLAQLAMHSSYETAGTADTLYMIRAAEAFYSTKLFANGDGSFRLE